MKDKALTDNGASDEGCNSIFDDILSIYAILCVTQCHLKPLHGIGKITALLKGYRQTYITNMIRDIEATPQSVTMQGAL